MHPIEFLNFISPPQLISQAGMLGILGYAIKKWINGTAKDISLLKRDKMEKEVCETRRQACLICFDGVKTDLEGIHLKLNDLTSNIPVLAENQKNVISILDKISKKQEAGGD